MLARVFGVDVAWTVAKRGSLWLLLYLFGYLHWDPRWLMLSVGFLFLAHIWRQQKIPRRPAISRAEFEPDVADPAAASRLPAGHLPAWVLNPDTQRAEWTNVIFKQLWPHLEEFLRQTLVSVEEDPQLQERLAGYHVRSLRFPTVSLGNIPPKLSGVKVHKSVHRDEIILDLNVQYNGNLHIGMEVVLAALPLMIPPAFASIKNMSFTGSLRVHLRPLLKDIPFIGGVTVSFLQAPEIDFDLGGIANSLDLPGISHLLRHVIQDQLEQTIVMPNSISMTLVNLDSASPLRFPSADTQLAAMPSGVLSVHLVEAKGLVNKDNSLLGQGKSDPYAKVRILADGVAHTFKSEVIPNSLDPLWKLLIDMPVDNPESLDDLFVEIWDEDVGVNDDFLGKCVIPLTVIRTAMTSGSTQDVWKPLDGVKRGSFHAEISWSELKLTRPDGQDEYHKGVLVVIVDSCSNLLGGRTGLKLPNPIVKVDLCGISQVTDPVIGSVNPVFSHRMNFLVRDPACDTLKIVVVDEKRNEGLGTLRFNLSDLLERPTLTMTNHQFVLSTKKATKGEKSPHIVLSLSFRYIYRPKTNSFGVHSSLQDLRKIMQTTVKQPKKDLSESLPPTFDLNETLESEEKLSDSSKLFPYIDDTSSTSTPVQNKGREPAKSANDLNGNSTMPKSFNETRSSSGNNGSLHAAFNSATLPTKILETNPPLVDLRPSILLSLKYSLRTMTLSVVVHRGRNLREMHTSAVPSPYVKLYLIESLGLTSNCRVRNSKRKTKPQKGKVNPIFEETLEYFLPPREIRLRRLEISVCSGKGVLGRNVVLGRCLVKLMAVREALDLGSREVSTIAEWHELQPGEVKSSDQMPRSRSAYANTGMMTRKVRSLSSSRTSLPGT